MRPQWRKVVKWAGTAVSVVLIVLWFASASHSAFITNKSGSYVGYVRGCFVIAADGPRGGTLGLYKAGPRPSTQWWFSFWRHDGGWEIRIPFWPFLVFAFASAAFAWRADILAMKLGDVNLVAHYRWAIRNQSKLRRGIMWVSGISAAILVAMWIASIWYVAGWQSPSGQGISIASGRFSVTHFAGRSLHEGGTILDRHRSSIDWWFEWNSYPLPSGWWIAIPIWAPFLICIGITGWEIWAILWKLKGHLPGMCVYCGYDRRGLEKGVTCPECGNENERRGITHD